MSFAQTVLPPKERSGWHRWVIAALVVVAIHVLALAVYLFTRPEGAPPGAPPDAVMIDLAPVAVAPPPQDEVDTPPQPDQQQPDTPPPPSQQVIPPPPDQPPPPTTDTTAPIEPDIQEAPQAEAVMSAPPPPPPPKPAVKTEKPAKPTHHMPKPQRRVRSTRTAQRADRQTAPRAGLNGAAVADWKSQISMRIQSEKPEGIAGADGTAYVAFSVSASGNIRGVRLARSSGSAAIDRAAIETVRRANPVPPAPPGVPGGSFTQPLHFH